MVKRYQAVVGVGQGPRFDAHQTIAICNCDNALCTALNNPPDEETHIHSAVNHTAIGLSMCAVVSGILTPINSAVLYRPTWGAITH